ncbi:IS1182 family transposase [Azohydromonas caseinilytica]|uniref:IS1182 family transposase n=1 Tax=Azohydromonas caseinilytica TaxID=2728836 RepID=A0A848FIW2_9BURK|nr:IS1182 family transposase [Azohydromonas caseinilytica]NML19214.1 IS1182 family transposase [Azohydromonas caseinilytica]
MATSYRPYAPDQLMLLPASLQDWLPEGHLAYFISDTVDALDLSAFHARYAGGGSRNQPFHPAMMVKVLVYGYATGVFSSRKIQRRLHEDLAFRFLGAGNFPHHRTIRDFRALHLQELGALFVQVVQLAREMGLVKLGAVAIDGTKVKANASRHKAMSYERMQLAEAELKAQIDVLLQRAKNTDEAEANEPELDIPAEIQRREVRLKAIAQARERLEQRQRDADTERGRSDDDDRRPRGPDGKPKKGGRYKRDFGVPEPKAQENFTDPDSRIMKRTGGGFDPSYNAQTAVDDTAHIIIAAELGNNAADSGQLLPMVQAIEANTGALPEQGLADAGYRSEENFKQLQGSATEWIVALGREGKQLAGLNPETHPHTAAMAAKLQSDEGKAAYRRRKWIAEPPNGWIKSVLGFRQFSLRGLHRVQAEWKLVCMALNLRRMSTMSAS